MQPSLLLFLGESVLGSKDTWDKEFLVSDKMDLDIIEGGTYLIMISSAQTLVVSHMGSNIGRGRTTCFNVSFYTLHQKPAQRTKFASGHWSEVIGQIIYMQLQNPQESALSNYYYNNLRNFPSGRKGRRIMEYYFLYLNTHTHTHPWKCTHII